MCRPNLKVAGNNKRVLRMFAGQVGSLPGGHPSPGATCSHSLSQVALVVINPEDERQHLPVVCFVTYFASIALTVAVTVSAAVAVVLALALAVSVAIATAQSCYHSSF